MNNAIARPAVSMSGVTGIALMAAATLLACNAPLSARATNFRFHAHAGAPWSAADEPQIPAIPAVPALPALPALPAGARDRVTNQVQALLEAKLQALPPGVNPGELTPDQQFALAEEALRRGGPADMGVLIGLLVPLGFFVMVVLVAWLFIRRKHAMIRAQADLRKQMLDKFATGAELAAFLESAGGRQFLAELQTYDPRPYRRGGPYGGLRGGLVCTLLGLAFLGLTLLGHRHLEVFSVVLLALGVGLLLSFALSRRLSRDPRMGPGNTGSGPGPFTGSGAPTGSVSGSGPILPA